MAIDVTQVRREELAATIRRNARALSLISGAAIVAATLDQDGAPRARIVPAFLVIVYVVAIAARERALANLASVRGADEMERMRKALPSRWVALIVAFAGALFGALDIRRGNITPFSVALLAGSVIAGLVVQTWVKPALDHAWTELRDLDPRVH